MDQYEGVYLGFAPTDESCVGYGEIKVSITEDEVIIETATGLDIYVERMLRSAFHAMSDYVISEIFVRTDLGCKRTSILHMFCHESGFPQLFFFKDPDLAFELRLRRRPDGLSELMGPTILCGPEQIRQGIFEDHVKILERDYEYPVVPRLASGGKMPQS